MTTGESRGAIPKPQRGCGPDAANTTTSSPPNEGADVTELRRAAQSLLNAWDTGDYGVPLCDRMESLRAALAEPQAQPSNWVMVPKEATDEMIGAYLLSNDRYWQETDKLPEKLGKWRNGTPAEATAAGYRAMIASAPQPPTGMTPMGFAIEAATAGELDAYDYGVNSTMNAVKRILDGQDNGQGIAIEPWESLRRRLLALVTQPPSTVDQPVAWHVVGPDGMLHHAASWREAAHEHINDSINEYELEEAAHWRVIPVFAHPQRSYTPLLCKGCGKTIAEHDALLHCPQPPSQED